MSDFLLYRFHWFLIKAFFKKGNFLCVFRNVLLSTLLHEIIAFRKMIQFFNAEAEQRANVHCLLCTLFIVNNHCYS